MKKNCLNFFNERTRGFLGMWRIRIVFKMTAKMMLRSRIRKVELRTKNRWRKEWNILGNSDSDQIDFARKKRPYFWICSRTVWKDQFSVMRDVDRRSMGIHPRQSQEKHLMGSIFVKMEVLTCFWRGLVFMRKDKERRKFCDKNPSFSSLTYSLLLY